MNHPLKPGQKIAYDGRRTGCSRPLSIRDGEIKKCTDVDGEYWYLLKNGKLCHQDKILKTK